MQSNITLKPLFVLLMFLCYGQSFSQSERQIQKGKVSYMTSSNVYVKFDDLSKINIGDSLFLQSNGQMLPALVIQAKSSTTCVATILDDVKIEVGQEVSHVYSPIVEDEKDAIVVIPENEKVTVPTEVKKEEEVKTTVSGRVSLANYSNFSFDHSLQNHRQFAAFSLNVKNLGLERLSLETYANYSLIHPSSPSENLDTRSLFRLFNLALHYDIKSGGRITLGRKYSSRLNSLGSIDGVQFEKKAGKFFYGGLAGFQPDLFNFGFDSDLFQYGLFVGQQLNVNKYSSTTTLGYVDQSNKGNTDRRFVAMQHSSFIGKFNFFLSSELDVYNPLTNAVRLTNFYLSARYRIKKINMTISYDSRKRVVYYQSFESRIDQYLNDDIRRDGLRFRVNYNISSKLVAGISANFRVQSNSLNSSNSYFGYVSYRNIPGLGGDINISYNMNFTDILYSSIPSIRYSRYLNDKKIRLYVFYRMQNLKYVKWEVENISNNFFGMGSTFQLSNKSLLSIFGEYSAMSTGGYLRLNASITQRF